MEFKRKPVKNYKLLSHRPPVPSCQQTAKMLAVLVVVLLFFINTAQCVLKTLYCTISDSCECDFQPNMRDLEWDLYRNLYGQHLVQDLVSEEVGSFLQKRAPDRPLVLSFHGSSGTGKTLVSSMLSDHLYVSGLGSPYVHTFVPTLDFPEPERVSEYRVELKNWVEESLTECARSVFIFDEMEKMPLGLIDVLEPFLGPSHVVYRTNYRKAIYIFISTTGEQLINSLALEYRQTGRDRDEIRASDLQDAISQTVYNSTSSGFYSSSIIREGLITRFVPFLPLTRVHVERCVQHELCQRGRCGRSDVVGAVGGDMLYTPAAGHFFSSTGCKAVAAKVSQFL